MRMSVKFRPRFGSARCAWISLSASSLQHLSTHSEAILAQTLPKPPPQTSTWPET